MKHKLGVCVPYRNREEHLHTFIPKVGRFLKERGIDFQIYICHQADEKLFNRGATKNIAAKHAIEDGCDYVVFHDIDMIPEDGADYSYPTEGPRHIATQISQMDYQLKYHEYFGGAVLFTKEHLETTNGYSNSYWDWGMEDDDLFWRCHVEGLTNDTYLTKGKKQKYYSFDGNGTYGKIPYKKEFRSIVGKSHTVSILVRAFQQPDKHPVFLIGDKQNKYIEYPIFRLPGYDYGLSFNNSRAMTLTYWNTFNQHNYMWVKRYDNQWTWMTAVLDVENQKSHFYLNGSEVDTLGGFGSPSPLEFKGRLKRYGPNDFYLGTSPSIPETDPTKYFKGDIAKVHIWDRNLTSDEIKDLHLTLPDNGLVLNLDANDNNNEFINYGVELKEEFLEIPNSILPFRKDGKFTCLPHEDEGIVDGTFKKGETTAANERRYVLQMQQGRVNYKKDGINSLEYKLISEQKLTPWAKMLNITL